MNAENSTDSVEQSKTAPHSKTYQSSHIEIILFYVSCIAKSSQRYSVLPDSRLCLTFYSENIFIHLARRVYSSMRNCSIFKLPARSSSSSPLVFWSDVRIVPSSIYMHLELFYCTVQHIHPYIPTSIAAFDLELAQKCTPCFPHGLELFYTILFHYDVPVSFKIFLPWQRCAAFRNRRYFGTST